MNTLITSHLRALARHRMAMATPRTLKNARGAE